MPSPSPHGWDFGGFGETLPRAEGGKKLLTTSHYYTKIGKDPEQTVIIKQRWEKRRGYSSACSSRACFFLIIRPATIPASNRIHIGIASIV